MNPSKQEGAADGIRVTDRSSRSEETKSSAAQRGDKTDAQAETNNHSESQSRDGATTSELHVEDTAAEEKDEKGKKPEQEAPKQTAEMFKRSVDAVAEARERYLARKRAREQL